MSQEFRFKTGVEHQPAGVRFNVNLEGGGDKAAVFQLTVDDLADGSRVAFNHEASPVVHDFTRGYTRWLGTQGVRAERGDEEITGIARDGLSAAQLLQVARDAVDMIDQRFANYRSSVIEATDYSDVIYEKRDGAAWLMINRPETFNARRVAMWTDLTPENRTRHRVRESVQVRVKGERLEQAEAVRG